jgi:hypothetical protein
VAFYLEIVVGFTFYGNILMDSLLAPCLTLSLGCASVVNPFSYGHRR